MITLFKFIKPLARWFLIIWVVIILVFSSIPKFPNGKIVTGILSLNIDFLFHFLEYVALAGLSVLSFYKDAQHFWSRRVLKIFLMLIIFATADESHQLLIPARSFQPTDLIFNIAGIVTGLLITLWINRIAIGRD